MFKLMEEPVSYQISHRLRQIKEYNARMGDYIVTGKGPRDRMLQLSLINLYNTYGKDRVKQVYLDMFVAEEGAA